MPDPFQQAIPVGMTADPFKTVDLRPHLNVFAKQAHIRQPGCSACLAMNDDKVPAGKYAVSTSNRNFEGRQGPGARTLLASPLVAAAAAVTGVITDPREFI